MVLRIIKSVPPFLIKSIPLKQLINVCFQKAAIGLCVIGFKAKGFLKDFRHKYIFRKVVKTIDDKNANSDGMGGSRPFKYEHLMKQSTFKWVYKYRTYDPVKDRKKNEEAVNIYFNIFEILRPYAASLLKILVMKPTFTEYILPYLLALITIGIIIYF